MTKITAVRSCTVRIPLDTATTFATRKVLARELTLVEIESDDGHKGIGFTYGGNRAGGLVTEAVRTLLGPLLLGEDPFRVEGLWEELYRESLLQGRTGSVMRALSALDIALWDRNARAAGLPLYKLLGAHRTDSVRGYASGGYYLDGKIPEMLGAEMKTYVDLGFDAVKMKVGLLGLAEEAARIAAVRDAIGGDVALMLDCSNCWTDIQTALRFVRMFERFDPYFIEEPFSPDDLENHARLVARTDVAIATGEIEAGRWRFKEMLDKQAATILQHDAICCGGITEWRRIAAIAAGNGISVCPHAYHEMHLHLAASTPNAIFVEVFTDDRIVNFRRLLDTQPAVEGGRVVLPTMPGLGYAYLDDVIDEYAIDPWA